MTMLVVAGTRGLFWNNRVKVAMVTHSLRLFSIQPEKLPNLTPDQVPRRSFFISHLLEGQSHPGEGQEVKRSVSSLRGEYDRERKRYQSS